MKKKLLTILLLTLTVSILSSASSWPGFIYLNKTAKSKKIQEKKLPEADIEIQPGAWLL